VQQPTIQPTMPHVVSLTQPQMLVLRCSLCMTECPTWRPCGHGLCSSCSTQLLGTGVEEGCLLCKLTGFTVTPPIVNQFLFAAPAMLCNPALMAGLQHSVPLQTIGGGGIVGPCDGGGGLQRKTLPAPAEQLQVPLQGAAVPPLVALPQNPGLGVLRSPALDALAVLARLAGAS